MPALRNAINMYLDAREREGTKAATLVGARSTLERFLRFTGNVRVEQLTPEDVWLWFNGEPGRPGLQEPHKGRHGVVPGVRGQTANKYRDRLSVFFKFCEKRKWTKVDLLGDLRRANGQLMQRKKNPRPILFLTEAQMHQMIATATWPRDKFMLTLARWTAVRVSELSRFTVGDLSLGVGKTGMITIRRTKTQEYEEETHELALTPALRLAVDAWLEHYASVMGITVEQLLLNKRWRLVPAQRTVPDIHDPHHRHVIGTYKPDLPMTNPGRTMRNVLAKMGYPVPEGVSTGMHVIRHSVADDFDNKHGRGAVQLLLGHKDRTTTDGYMPKNKDRIGLNDLLENMPLPDADATVTYLDDRRAANG